jgi:hypothetical protein
MFLTERLTTMMDDMRIKHSFGVAKFMYDFVKDMGCTETKAQEMFILGILHDVGYAFTNKIEDHPMAGGMVLKESGYKYWREVAFHGNASSLYVSEELDLLNKADLSVEFTGIRVTPEVRLSNIKDRYGNNSFQYKEAKRLYEKHSSQLPDKSSY